MGFFDRSIAALIATNQPPPANATTIGEFLDEAACQDLFGESRATMMARNGRTVAPAASIVTSDTSTWTAEDWAAMGW